MAPRCRLFFLTDLTVNTSRTTRSNLDFQAGVRNLAGIKYSDPIALYQQVDTLPHPDDRSSSR